MRVKRNQRWGDKSSPELFYLKRVAGNSRMYSLEDAAREIETNGAMTTEDVIHVMSAFVRRLRIILTRGDKIKVKGLGTFFTTFCCTGAKEEKDCTVKNIHRVNVRFVVDNALRLVNDSIATTRGAGNNIEFCIKGETATGKESEEKPTPNPDPDPNPGGGGVDPAA